MYLNKFTLTEAPPHGRPLHPILLLLAAIILVSTGKIPASTFAPTRVERAAAPEQALRDAANFALLPRKIDEQGRTYVQLDDMLFVLRDGAGIESAFTGERWTNGIVYYVFDPAVSAAHRQNWQDAAATWSAVAPLTFIQGMGSGNYVYVKNGNGNSSYVGMIGGSQTMNIFNWNYRYIIAHEIGHALGAEHEHQRSDRDSYVMIDFNNVANGFADQFQLESSINYGLYDFDSIMHYDQCAFSIDCPHGSSCACSNSTIVVLPPNDTEWQDAIGQISHLSQLDGTGMAQRYGQQPSAPAANVATNVTSTGFSANWGDVSGATGYRLDVSTSGSFSSYVTGYQNLDVSNVTSFSVINLSPNTTYYYRVRSYNNTGESSNSNTIAVVTAPAVPTANAATSITASSFAAHWSSVSGATGYRLDVSTSNTFSSYVGGYQNLDVGNVTTWNVTGLSAGGTYYYRVRASNGETSGNNSNVITVVTVPAAPAATAASGITSRWFSANWNSSTGASGYRLDVAKDSSFTSYVNGYQDRDVGSVTSFGVKGLSANTNYYYRVRACNGNGLTGNSNVITVLTATLPNPTPNPTATPKPSPTPGATATPRPSSTPK